MPRELVLHLPPSAEAPPIDGPELVGLAARDLRLPADAIGVVRVSRLSFDARRRERRWRLAATVWMRGETPPPESPASPPDVQKPREEAPRVAIVGSGPAGMFCALDCLAAGLNAVVLERGQDVQTRRRALAAANRGQPIDAESNYCFGEGGAGTYSDGKLYTRSGSREEIRGVLELLVAHGAPREILVSWRPHVGSNRLPEVVRALRETILRAGGEVRFGHRAVELETEADAGGRARVRAVLARRDADGATVREPCDAVVLAAGHSAFDALAMAARAGARLVPKGFAMGVRIEHPQDWLDARQYGGLRESCDLPAALYELATEESGRGVYSFCMCPGGFVVPASTESARVVVNGMSLSRRDSPFANSGLVVSIEPEDWCGRAGADAGWDELVGRAARVDDAVGGGPTGGKLPENPDDDPLFGARLQRALERAAAEAGGGGNRAPSQRADAFAASRPADAARASALATSYRPGVTAVDLCGLLPRGLGARLRAALGEFDRRLPGFASEQGQCLGVESRTSSPVRIARDEETLESAEIGGLYPSGEGAGYAGGIVSAALDGRRVAAALARKLAR